MTKIGILSDSHGVLDDRVFDFFKSCDEIWHAGDVGADAILDRLESFKMLRAVYGNIDSHNMRQRIPKDQLFYCEKIKVFMTHIGGYPGKYNTEAYQMLKQHRPHLFVCGHSHILKVMYDKQLNVLFVNPGAEGNFGFHQKRTLLRFTIDGEEMKDMELIELGDR